MTTGAWITMIGTMTLVWGGFGLVLLAAVRKELEKRQ